METFPVLRDYTDCWPVRDLIKMHLKYTSSRQRCSNSDAAVQKVAAVVKRVKKAAAKSKVSERSITACKRQPDST
jgi:hypothetical protein